MQTQFCSTHLQVMMHITALPQPAACTKGRFLIHISPSQAPAPLQATLIHPCQLCNSLRRSNSVCCCRSGGPPRDCSHHPSCASCCSSFCAARTCQTTLKHLSNPEKRSQSQTVTHPMNSSSRKPHGVAASGDMRFWMRRTATSKLQGMPQPPKRSARLPSALQRVLQRQQRGEQMRMCCLAGIGPAPHLPERQPTAMDRLQSPRRLQLQLQQQRLQPRGPRLQSVRPRRRLWRKC